MYQHGSEDVIHQVYDILIEIKEELRDWAESRKARRAYDHSMVEFWKQGCCYITDFFDIFKKNREVIRTKFGNSITFDIHDFFPIFDEYVEAKEESMDQQQGSTDQQQENLDKDDKFTGAIEKEKETSSWCIFTFDVAVLGTGNNYQLQYFYIYWSDQI